MSKRDPNLIQAQGAAYKLNKRFACSKPGVLEFEDVAMALNVLVVPFGVTGAAARLVRNKDEGLIRLNSRLTHDGAKRFAIGHELGHWLLHENESQFFVCTAANFRDYYGSPMEMEANYFASELLIPTGLFRPMMQKSEPDLKKIGGWADLFRASLTAMCLRFLRDTSFNCIAASIKDGAVEWWWRKEDGRKVWLSKGQRVEQGSLTWEVAQGNTVDGGMEEVDPQAWFAHLPFEYTGELREQCIVMPQYGKIFTLLWMP